jgi:hypothetical protein
VSPRGPAWSDVLDLAGCEVDPPRRASEAVRADKMVRLFRAKSQLFEKHWPPERVAFGLLMLRAWAFTRMLAWGAAACLNRSRAQGFHAWREIWRRRSEYARAGKSSGTSGESSGVLVGHTVI